MGTQAVQAQLEPVQEARAVHVEAELALREVRQVAAPVGDEKRIVVLEDELRQRRDLRGEDVVLLAVEYGIAHAARRSAPQSPVHLLVAVGHLRHGEVALDVRPAVGAIDLVHPLDGVRHLDQRVADEARASGDDDLGHRAAGRRDHGRAAGHGLDHDETEGLRPVDGEEQRPRAPEKRCLVGLADLTDELDQWIVEQRHHHALEVLPVDGVHLGRDLQRHAGPPRDLDRHVRLLLGRDATQEGQVALVPGRDTGSPRGADRGTPCPPTPARDRAGARAARR